jgi:hypothetical protein
MRALILLLLAATGAALAEPSDVTAVRDKLTVWSDGKKHFIAMVMTSRTDSPIFWSEDGKRFLQLRVFGGASDGYDDDLKMLDRNFWEPRQRGGEADLDYKKERGNLDVHCELRHVMMEKLAAAEAKKVLDGASFEKPLWNRYAYALVRDESGRYYYVDNVREPEGQKRFRLFAGPKGGLKLQKLTNIVSDSEGDIFATPKGELRLILSKKDSSFVAGKKRTPLVWIPVEDNAVMIYTDLGVYSGEPLGTPCDAL